MVFCFSDPLGSAVDRRAYFLLLRQKKVAKEKATPGSAPGCARSLALLDGPGGWLNSPLRGSDNASRLPPDRLRCSAPLRGTPKTSGAERPMSARLRPGLIIPWEVPSNAGQSGAVVSRCLRPAGPSLARRPTARVAQGTRAAGTDPGSPSSLLTFFLAKQEESKARVKREIQP